MHTTRLTPTTTTPRRLRAIRRGPAVLAVTLALGAGSAAHGVATSAPVSPRGGCTLAPAADSMPYSIPALLSTVRATDTGIEMLHDVQCTDGRVGTVWIAADVI